MAYQCVYSVETLAMEDERISNVLAEADEVWFQKKTSETAKLIGLIVRWLIANENWTVKQMHILDKWYSERKKIDSIELFNSYSNEYPYKRRVRVFFIFACNSDILFNHLKSWHFNVEQCITISWQLIEHALKLNIQKLVASSVLFNLMHMFIYYRMLCKNYDVFNNWTMICILVFLHYYFSLC